MEFLFSVDKTAKLIVDFKRKNGFVCLNDTKWVITKKGLNEDRRVSS